MFASAGPLAVDRASPLPRGKPDLRVQVPLKLSDALVEDAKVVGAAEHRSVPKQIEYWSQIGKIAAENPDLPFSVIRDILIADQEAPVGEYQFD